MKKIKKNVTKLKIPKIKPKVKVTYVEFSPGVMAPQFDLGYKTDAVKELIKYRGRKV